jgi:hypothetical protein
MSRQRRRARTRIRRPRRQPKEPKFIRVLALSFGYCGICATSFKTGDPIYWCAKTDKTDTFRCHEICYLTRMQKLSPSWKPSPTESELAAMRTSQRT